MPTLNSPLQLSPPFRPKVWGRRDLGPLYPDFWTTRRGNVIRSRHTTRNGSENEPIGEVWLTADDAVILNGPIAGLSLSEACRQYGAELTGARQEPDRFPILAKFIFTSEWLSVQVHPDDDFAKQHEQGSRGKCEMWYILEAKDDAEFLLGLHPGITLGALRSALEKGKSRSVLQSFHPSAGETIFVPPGTVHALGSGLTLFEAEENSDITYRLDDFGRVGLDGKPRPLHIEKGLAVTRPEAPAHCALSELELQEPFGRRRFLVACPFFALEALEFDKLGTFSGPGTRVEALCVTGGEGRVETSAGWFAYRPGDIWLIPPATPSYRLAPEEPSSILKFYVPDLEEDFRKPLMRAGRNAEEISRVVFE
jgi:mannose-6-phosphate isomerase